MMWRRHLVDLLVVVVFIMSVGAKKHDEECTMECKNGGRCQVGVNDFGLTLELTDENMLHGDPLSMDIEASKSVSQKHVNAMHCVCPTGYTGSYCEIKFVPCGDNGKCFNGEDCEVDEDDSGNVFSHCECDAKVSNFSASYSMHFCHEFSTIHCQPSEQDLKEGAEYKHSFCNNGGQCRHQLGHPGETHQTCACTSGWEGPHCEYVLGTAPKALSMDTQESLPPSVIAVTVLIGFLAFSVFFIVTRRVYIQRRELAESKAAAQTTSNTKTLDVGNSVSGLEIT